ncbi:MAG: 4Fe-4S dicluster domain-containing protein [Myxococcales bacterium]|nr:MAG: 4Fe-4S dicluster domain-containing protein [Myxococcales bacterium]
MQRKLEFRRRSDEEQIKDAGLVLDFDEIARKGSMSREEQLVAKWYGLYSMRQANNHMVRVTVPGGVLTSAQVRALAQIAKDYGQGKICFTTRQAAQLHWLKLKMLPEMLRDLRQAGLTSFHGCGDVLRNTASCPLAETCPHRRFDVRPYALDMHRTLTACDDLFNLPRKYKVTFSGCEAGCGQAYMNCVGFMAIVRERPDGAREEGFRVVIGGGLGWSPFVGQELYSFIPKTKVNVVARAVTQLFRDHGDRWNRNTSRLKYVVYRQGIAKCREIVEENLRKEGADPADCEVAPVVDCGPPIPERPLTASDPVGTDGKAIVRAMIPKGELGWRELIRLAELSEDYGDKYLYSTNRQNLEIHGVDVARASQCKAEIEALGFDTDGFFGLTDIVPCVGTTYCPLAVSKTREMYDALLPLAKEEKYRPIRDRAFINITGCPNSCSPYWIADIGLRGCRIREQYGSTEGYEIRVGGTERKYGVKLGDFKADDGVRVVRAALDTFLNLRRDGESLAANVARVGSKPYKEAVKALGIAYDLAPNPREYSVFTGLAGSPLDMKTIARDVPCQAACPARTRVPEYIQKIAAGEHQEAYKINQEDNVFPGVLGRVCTRPCETACRHQWTGVEGPVAICHLKRSAADRKKNPPRPLEPWFEPTGKSVAVIGAGPAGLTVARELKRYGHEATVIECEHALGGMMKLSIPHFRLPRDVIDEEIKAILDSGVELQLGEWVDKKGVETLLKKYDAVVITAGAIKASAIDLPGLDAAAAMGGLTFMKHYNLGRPVELTPPVLVIGGGFTAVDCARASRRLLGRAGGRVAIMYRRTKAQMSATDDEFRQMALEGIDIETLVAPAAARMEKGRLKSLVFQRNTLTGGTDDGGGKASIRPLEGSDFDVACGTLMFAIGQTRQLEILPAGVSVTGAHAADRPGLFIAGDFKTGSLDVIHAVAEGKGAADEVDFYLMGRKRRETKLNIVAVESGETGRLRDHDMVQQPHMPHLPAEDRGLYNEVELGFTDPDAHLHAYRCYLCHHKYEIDQDKCIHCDLCIKASPRDCIRRVTRLFRDADGAPVDYVETELPKDATYIWIDSDNCIRCGACQRACPTGAISLRRAETTKVNCG